MSNDTELDVNDCCGAFAEIGSVIHADDTALTFSLTESDQAALDSKKAAIETYINATFKDIDVKFTPQADFTYNVEIHFSCTAEKMIFEMNLRHIMGS